MQKFHKKNSYNFKSSFPNQIEDEQKIKLIYEQKNHHAGSIYCLDWSISSRLIASGSNDKTIKLLAVPDFEESFNNKDEALELILEGHKGVVRSVCFEPTSDFVLLSGGTSK